MSTPTTSNGDYRTGSNDGSEKSTRSSASTGNCDGESASSRSTPCLPGDKTSMKVQDFISLLAKEVNINNMTVETNDGRRISATFKHGLPTCTSTPQNGSLESNIDPSKTLSKEVSGDDGESSNATIMAPTRDIATTIALMGTEKIASAAPSTLQTPNSETSASQEWAINYQNKHVVVTCSTIVTGTLSSFQNGNGQKTNGSTASGSDTRTALPPKKRATVKTEEGKSECSWNAMSALVDAATVAQREHEEDPEGVLGMGGSASAKVAMTMATGANIPTTILKKKPAKRKPRKIIPEIKEYVEFTQKDVLFGRGGRSNRESFNCAKILMCPDRILMLFAVHVTLLDFRSSRE